MKVFNPTGWSRNIKVDSKEYRLLPFKFIEFSDEYGKIIVTSENYRAKGVVSLDYDDQAKIKYRNFESFKKAQAISGLNSVLEYLYRVREHESEAYDAMVKEKNNADNKSAVRVTANPSRFDADIQLAKKWLAIWKDYTPPKSVESDFFVEEVVEKPVLEFDPSRVGDFNEEPLNVLPKGLGPQEVKSRGRKPKDEPLHDSNSSA